MLTSDVVVLEAKALVSRTTTSLVSIEMYDCCVLFSGENVEEAFLETAKKIYQNIQDGRFVGITVTRSVLYMWSYIPGARY